ncbi:hypothetical protein BJV77DRAFT_1063605 [Russula vinacea]|nr:hypothetical protein BJV77DRAFT_1063605 [Russula vinacea]
MARYIPEIAYALAFSSISVHLLWQRRAAETDRRHYSARLSILDELAGRLRAGEVTDAEVARLRRLAETVGEDTTHAGERIGWRDVVFGRKESGLEREEKEELERRELERVQSEFSVQMIPHEDRNCLRRFYHIPHVFLRVRVLHLLAPVFARM